MAQRNIRDVVDQKIAATDRQVIQELAAVGHQTGSSVANKHRRVVKDFSSENRPVFSYRVTVTPKFVRVTVFPRGRGRAIYRYIDLGTKGPYFITAKNKPFLKFQTGQTPRTLPGAKFNQGTGGQSGAWATKKQVTHPGIQKRGFSETFEKEALPEMRRGIKTALRNGISRAA
jgi:hypothetical protein